MTAGALFTRDLRVHDQPALSAAVEAGGPAVPLFVVDDTLAHCRRAANRLVFLWQSLEDLRGSLRERGGDLVIRRSDPVEETVKIAEATGARTVFVGDDASGYAQRRRARLERERLEFRVEDTVTAVPSGELAPAGRDHHRRQYGVKRR